MTVPLRFGKDGKPEPLGVKAAAERMAVWIAETEKRGDLTPDERRLVVAVSAFFSDEYERISSDNERMEGDIRELRQQIVSLEERVRDLSGETQATAGDE